MPCVVIDAKDEARLASAHQRQAQYVEARGLDDAAVMLNVALAVKNRNIQPTVVRTKTRSPNDSADGVAVQLAC